MTQEVLKDQASFAAFVEGSGQAQTIQSIAVNKPQFPTTIFFILK